MADPTAETVLTSSTALTSASGENLLVPPLAAQESVTFAGEGQGQGHGEGSSSLPVTPGGSIVAGMANAFSLVRKVSSRVSVNKKPGRTTKIVFPRFKSGSDLEGLESGCVR